MNIDGMTIEDMRERITEIETEALTRWMDATGVTDPSWGEVADVSEHVKLLDIEEWDELDALRHALDVAHHEPTD